MQKCPQKSVFRHAQYLFACEHLHWLLIHSVVIGNAWHDFSLTCCALFLSLQRSHFLSHLSTFLLPLALNSWSVCLKTLDVCVFQVYYQECEMFGLVAKMLIAKDQSLERSIQSSLQENLRDIGKRCVEAMEKFIVDYDSREMSHWSDTYSPSCLTRIDPTGKKKKCCRI